MPIVPGPFTQTEISNEQKPSKEVAANFHLNVYLDNNRNQVRLVESSLEVLEEAPYFEFQTRGSLVFCQLKVNKEKN